MAQGKVCFVISTIGHTGSAHRKHADLVLNYLIKPVAADEFRYAVWRGDESLHSGMITIDVINTIISADLVVADLTFLNPNVFYELALRHFVRKPVVHLASMDTKLPFDNADHRAIIYDITDWDSHERTRTTLKKVIHAIEQPDYTVTNPVTVAQAHETNAHQAAAIETMSDALRLLEDRIARLLSEPLPRGRVTKRSVTAMLDGHRDEILKIVTAMRQRIDERAMAGNRASTPQAVEMLRRLGRLEEIVRGNNLVH